MLDFGMYGIAVALIAIMLSVAGMVLGIGYAVNDRRLKEFGMSEIYQCVMNGVIVGSLIVAFGSGGIVTMLINNSVTSASLGATCSQQLSGNYAICFAYNYLVGLNPVTINGASYPTLIDASLGLLAPVSLLYTGLSVLSSIKLSLGIVSIGFASALNPVLTALNYVIEALTASVIAIEVQGVLLRFIAAVAVPVLLPIGIVLRTFYLTRKLGGAMMAIAIGLFAVLPMSYVLNAELTSTYVGTLDNSTINGFVLGATQTNADMISHATGLSGNLTSQASSWQLFHRRDKYAGAGL